MGRLRGASRTLAGLPHQKEDMDGKDRQDHFRDLLRADTARFGPHRTRGYPGSGAQAPAHRETASLRAGLHLRRGSVPCPDRQRSEEPRLPYRHGDRHRPAKGGVQVPATGEPILRGAPAKPSKRSPNRRRSDRKNDFCGGPGVSRVPFSTADSPVNVRNGRVVPCDRDSFHWVVSAIDRSGNRDG